MKFVSKLNCDMVLVQWWDIYVTRGLVENERKKNKKQMFKWSETWGIEGTDIGEGMKKSHNCICICIVSIYGFPEKMFVHYEEMKWTTMVMSTTPPLPKLAIKSKIQRISPIT
jgi:hypothetical protein